MWRNEAEGTRLRVELTEWRREPVRVREGRRKPCRRGEDTNDALRGRETPEAGVIGAGDPGWTVSAQARMVLEQFTGEAGARNVLFTAARFFLGGGGSARNANLGTASISRMTEGMVS